MALWLLMLCYLLKYNKADHDKVYATDKRLHPARVSRVKEKRGGRQEL